MFRLNVKTKTLLILSSISVLGLVSFGWLSFVTYKKDKLAFVYDQIVSQSGSVAQMVNQRAEKFEFLLAGVVTQLSDDRLELKKATIDYLNPRQDLLSIGMKTIRRPQTILHSKDQSIPDWNTVELKKAGLRPYDLANHLFLFKKPLKGDGEFAFVLFRDYELSQALSSSGYRSTALVYEDEIVSRSDVVKFAQFTDMKILKKTPIGMREISYGDKTYLLSHADTHGNGFVLSLYDSKSLLLVQEVFVRQLLCFLALMGFISLLVGSYASDLLTKYLREVTEATKKIGEGDFEVNLEIRSGDEFEIVGNGINTMAGKIKHLLEELRIYNLHLEDKVAQRTAELQNLTNIQKTMLNSLGQGFVMIDREKKVAPVYSKIAVQMFDTKPDQAAPTDIITVKEDEKPLMDELLSHLFEETVDFDTFAKIAPERRTNSLSREIFLEYAPIRNEEDARIDYMLVIATDKTDEIQAKVKFESELKFSRMILGLARNREACCRIITDSFRMIEECHALTSDAPASYREIQRRVHTIKGCFGFYYVAPVTDLAHELETRLETSIKQGMIQPEIDLMLLKLSKEINSFVSEYDDIIRYRQHNSGRLVSFRNIIEFESVLRDRELQERFHDMIYTVDIRAELSYLEKSVDEIATTVGKKARFILETDSADFPEGPWQNILPELTHVIRNAIDHGIETPSERKSSGKEVTGEIRFSFKRLPDSISLIISDDGAGIDVAKIQRKFPEVVDLESAIRVIALGGVSSKDAVTELSGRGVGVSAVIQKVEELHGTWKIDSEKGKGTRIHVTLPFKIKTQILKVA